MTTVSYRHACDHLDEVAQSVCATHDPALITGPDGSAVVMLSWDDYRFLEETATQGTEVRVAPEAFREVPHGSVAQEETAYLLKSPTNAARLFESLAEWQGAGGTTRELFED